MLNDRELDKMTERASEWMLWRQRAVPLLIAAGLLVAGGAPFHANLFR